jgi:hypothetical protein
MKAKEVKGIREAIFDVIIDMGIYSATFLKHAVN